MSLRWMRLSATSLVETLLRWQTLVCVIWAIVVVTSLSLYVARFSVDNSVAVWFDSGDPERERLELFNDVFGETEWTYLWLETDLIFDSAFLKDLSDLTNRLESLDNVKRVISLTNVKDNEFDEEGTLYYTPIFPTQDGSMPTDEEIEFLRVRLQQNPIFHNNVFRIGDDRHTIIAIQNENRLSDPRPYRMNLIDAIRNVVKLYPRMTDVGLAGTTPINGELNRAAKRDMIIFYVLISILLVGSGYVLLPTNRDLLPFLVVIVGAVLPTVAMISAFDLPFNMVTVMLPTVVVSMGTSYIIHFINDFHVNLKHSEAQTALTQTVRVLWRPGFWTAATTIIAFASLGLSTVMPVRQFGLLSAFGNFLAWLLTMCVAPILLHRSWSGMISPEVHLRPWRNEVKRRLLETLNYRSLYILFTVFLLVISITGLLQLEADTDYVHFFRDGSRIPMDYQKLGDSQFAQSYVNVMIDFSEQGSYTDADNFKALLLLEDRINAMSEVVKVNSVTSLLREVDKAFNGSETSEQAFRAYGGPQVSQLLLLAEASGNDDVPDLISGNNQYVQLVVMTDYMSTKVLNEFRQRLESVRAKTLPTNLKMSITGTNVLWANMDDQVVHTQVFSVLATSVMLVILLPIILGSVVLGVVGFAVSFLPIVITLGLMAWFGVTVNIATCLIGGAVIGVAVDDSIYMLSRIRDEVQNGLSLEDSIKEALTVTGVGIVSTSMILMGGFFSMTVSNFLPSAYFGVFFAVGICSALLADLLLLPIILNWLYKRKVLVSGHLGGTSEYV